MFALTFDPDAMRRPTARQRAGLERAGEMDLRYEYFATKVSLVTDEFGTESFSGTPALDFVFCALLAARDIRQGAPGRISFTENDLLIHFTPVGDSVTVTRSWDPIPGHCTMTEFVTAVSRFSRDVLDLIVRRHPGFGANPAHAKLTGMVAELVTKSARREDISGLLQDIVPEIGDVRR